MFDFGFSSKQSFVGCVTCHDPHMGDDTPGGYRPLVQWDTDSGIPLSVVPSRREVSKATVTYVRTTRSKREQYTRGRLTGTGRKASLSKSQL